MILLPAVPAPDHINGDFVVVWSWIDTTRVDVVIVIIAVVLLQMFVILVVFAKFDDK